MKTDLDFSGEFFVPGRSGERMEADHLERYRFACRFARDRSVLDIACGAGYAAPLFLGAGARRYQGVDINPELVAHARATYGSAGARFDVGDIAAYADGEVYDLVSCFETIEHVGRYREALENLRALLRPQGILLVSSPNRRITSPGAPTLADRPHNRFHTQEFLPEELVAELRRAGFAVDSQSLFGQRQRRLHSSLIMRKLARLVFGNPNRRTSAVVTPVADKAPRYFIVVARKPDAPEA